MAGERIRMWLSSKPQREVPCAETRRIGRALTLMRRARERFDLGTLVSEFVQLKKHRTTASLPVEVYEQLMEGCAMVPDCEAAEAVFEALQRGSVHPSMRLLRAYAMAFCRDGQLTRAVEVFHSMKKFGYHGDTTTARAILSGSQKVTDLKIRDELQSDIPQLYETSRLPLAEGNHQLDYEMELRSLCLVKRSNASRLQQVSTEVWSTNAIESPPIFAAYVKARAASGYNTTVLLQECLAWLERIQCPPSAKAWETRFQADLGLIAGSLGIVIRRARSRKEGIAALRLFDLMVSRGLPLPLSVFSSVFVAQKWSRSSVQEIQGRFSLMVEQYSSIDESAFADYIAALIGPDHGDELPMRFDVSKYFSLLL